MGIAKGDTIVDIIAGCSLALPAPSVAPSLVVLNVEDLEKATEGLGVTIRDLPTPESNITGVTGPSSAARKLVRRFLA